MTTPKTLIQLAAIAGAHGIKGEVLIKPFGDDPYTLKDYGPLSNKDASKTFTIQKLKPGKKNFLVAKIKEITDRNQAEAAKGTVLCITRDKLPAPDEDEFYFSDLIGLEVKLENGDLYGKIIKVEDFGAGPLIEIMPQNSQTSMYLSFTMKNVPTVSLSEGHIIVILPDYDEVKSDGNEGAQE